MTVSQEEEEQESVTDCTMALCGSFIAFLCSPFSVRLGDKGAGFEVRMASGGSSDGELNGKVGNGCYLKRYDSKRREEAMKMQ